MLRTLVLAMFSVITTLGGGLLLANMVAHHKWLNFYRYIFYVPTVVSAITMGRLWSMMLMPSASGLMNTFIRNVFGVQTPVNWLGDPRITLYVVMGDRPGRRRRRHDADPVYHRHQRHLFRKSARRLSSTASTAGRCCGGSRSP